MTIEELAAEALKVTGDYQPSKEVSSGGVGAAILTKAGNVYTGVCIDTASSLGFCAEHAAIADMLKHHESEIVMLAVVTADNVILTPCGRCREFLYQLNKANAGMVIAVSLGKTATLKKLLPLHWLDILGER
jgi:cytidine deaminase